MNVAKRYRENDWANGDDDDDVDVDDEDDLYAKDNVNDVIINGKGSKTKKEEKKKKSLMNSKRKYVGK